jgi:hypothetical protein
MSEFRPLFDAILFLGAMGSIGILLALLLR